MDVFGSVADLYEKERPGYPTGVADAIIAYHGGVPTSVAEIGAGTGKGTEVLAAIGAPLTCIEPDQRMAGLLSAKFPQARVYIGTFEQWTPPPGGVAVLGCAMAWHWLDPVTRNARARDALAQGGVLALFGHRYGYADAEQAAAIQSALDSLDPTVKLPRRAWGGTRRGLPGGVRAEPGANHVHQRARRDAAARVLRRGPLPPFSPRIPAVGRGPRRPRHPGPMRCLAHDGLRRQPRNRWTGSSGRARVAMVLRPHPRRRPAPPNPRLRGVTMRAASTLRTSDRPTVELRVGIVEPWDRRSC